MGFSLIIFGAGVVLLVLVAANLAALFYTTAGQLSAAAHQRQQESEWFSERLAVARTQLRRAENIGSWNGTRKFQIQRIVPECSEVASFYLVPHDGRPLPGFLPGQFLTFELDVPGQKGRTIRCYSLSDRPRPDYYRVTIKRVPAPPEPLGLKPGLVSNHFHTAFKAGDLLDVKAPGGGFFLDVSQATPVVLLSGGVGITPMISMANEISANSPQREVWFFLSVRNRREHIFKEHLEELARTNPRLRLQICYSRPEAGDLAGRDYQHEGRLTIDLLRRVLPANNFDYFMCGPGPMMSDLNDGLRAWGVPEKHIHFEAFGPASVKRTAPPAATPVGPAARVNFVRSNRDVEWSATHDSLLDLALNEGVSISYACRAGNCGTCKTAIKSGKVTYRKQPGCDVESGSCLTCVAVPEGDLRLDA